MPRTRTQRLGQHFLVDTFILRKVVQACRLDGQEIVCEAGTGTGALTKELCKRARLVMSYEVDRQLFDQAKLMQVPNLSLIHKDLFSEQDIEFDVFVSNLPYSRSRDAFEWLATKKFSRGVVMVQKEFAEKLLAKPGDRNYRAISAIASHCFAFQSLFAVPPAAFEPPPKVESTVLAISSMSRMTAPQIRKTNLLFSKRNKRASAVAAKMGVKADFGDRRIYQLDPGEVVRLAG